VRFGKPLGPSPLRVVRRSHKKVACFDDRVAYLGGINFSDHNFAWHDMMLRIESPELAALLAADFRGAFVERARAFDVTIGALRVIGTNGRANRVRFAPVTEAMDTARHSIRVVSPYLSHPFTRHLKNAAARGVRVQVLMPDRNNKGNLARHLIEHAFRGGLEILRYRGGMSHMKAMVIDDDLLITGSSNFDFMSYHILEEHVVMSRDAALLGAFDARIWQPDAATALRPAVRSSTGTRLGDAAVRAGAALARILALPEEEGA
jgi:cardiolipin synthase